MTEERTPETYVIVSGHEHDEWTRQTPNYLFEESQQLMQHTMRLSIWRYRAVMRRE